MSKNLSLTEKIKKEDFILSSEALNSLLQYLINEYKLYAPVKSEAKFAKVDNVNEIDLNYVSTILPPKKYFLPPIETIMNIQMRGFHSYVVKEPEVNEERIILFGVHPCDLNAIRLLDKILNKTYPDLYYSRKRDKTIIIALNCSAVDEYCFCTTFGRGPHAYEGYDLLLTKLKEGYLLEVGSKKGRELIKYSRLTPSPLTRTMKCKVMKEKTKIITKLEEKMRKKRIPNVETITEFLMENYGHDLWKSISERCLSCGVCNIVCPTCYCFDVIDKIGSNIKEIDRKRIWDSCLIPDFAEIANGENFRRDRESRLKHRIYHKLVYFFEQYGEVGCVGCGRCIRWCMKRIDPVEALKEVIKTPALG
ncbi:TPA: hypothetical protein ENX78_17205 [Candidatus Poribacteria bacterium]|nr:hypothetical protein [Candidatus Poribacteria bacterium]